MIINILAPCYRSSKVVTLHFELSVLYYTYIIRLTFLWSKDKVTFVTGNIFIYSPKSIDRLQSSPHMVRRCNIMMQEPRDVLPQFRPLTEVYTTFKLFFRQSLDTEGFLQHPQRFCIKIFILQTKSNKIKIEKSI